MLVFAFVHESGVADSLRCGCGGLANRKEELVEGKFELLFILIKPHIIINATSTVLGAFCGHFDMVFTLEYNPDATSLGYERDESYPAFPSLTTTSLVGCFRSGIQGKLERLKLHPNT